jgi:hypothetical protein
MMVLSNEKMAVALWALWASLMSVVVVVETTTKSLPGLAAAVAM